MGRLIAGRDVQGGECGSVGFERDQRGGTFVGTAAGEVVCPCSDVGGTRNQRNSVIRRFRYSPFKKRRCLLVALRPFPDAGGAHLLRFVGGPAGIRTPDQGIMSPRL